VRISKHRLICCSRGTDFGSSVIIWPGCVPIGYKRFIGSECWIPFGTNIGDFTKLAGRVAIVGGNQRFDIAGVPAIEAVRAQNKLSPFMMRFG
jgi:UDP-3-O-[3-hydroxymyristoyl] glucosamine N-acyltransferase